MYSVSDNTVRWVDVMETSFESAYNLAPFVNQLELSPKTQKRAQAILVAAERTSLTARKAPASLMAAALYIAGILEGERRTQLMIGRVTGVSTTTIQTRYRELVHGLDIRSE